MKNLDEKIIKKIVLYTTIRKYLQRIGKELEELLEVKIAESEEQ